MANLKAVLTRPKVSENYSRNAFDRSCSVNTSYQLGGLDVVFAEPFVAGSHVKLNRAIFQRTSDVNTAAFPKIDTHVEFFAVPIRQLWMWWNNYKLNIQDFGSTFEGSINSSTQSFSPSTPVLPFFDVHDFLKQINTVLYDGTYDASNPPTYNYLAAGVTYAAMQQHAMGASRLLGALGYGQYPYRQVTDSSGGVSQVFGCNILKALAYQKVYYDYFRNTAYENNDPSFYNHDDLITASQIDKKRVGKIFQYRYVNYRKDYMQSVYPALNYSVSSPNGFQWSIPDSVLYKAGTNSLVAPVTGDGGQTLLVGHNSPSWNANIFSVQQLRASFAFDKLLRASAYAPKHVRDQFEARYGVKGVESGSECTRIGAYMNDIVIQEVVNTAASLGQIGGKGVGYNGFGKDIEFTCKEDSIILGLIYSLPRSSYDATFIQNWNAKLDREDFFIPEFMNLGMQPFTQYENTFMNSVGGSLVAYWQGINGIVGYKDRYSEYKLGVDRNLGNFLKGGVLSDFVTHSNQDPASLNYGAANANYFKVKPTDLDSIFVTATDVSKISTDKFITHIDIKCICNQNMSVHGQPTAVS